MRKLDMKAGGSQKGFTLIEMSIVLVIIGLIIGGILKGQEIINSSRQKNLIVQIDSINAALNTFADKYQAVPGDYSLASANIAPTLGKGNGDGIVGTAAASIGTIIADVAHAATAAGAVAAGDGENMLFWCHLSGANLIGNSSTDCTVDAGGFGGGSPLPATAYPQVGMDVVYGTNGENGVDTPTALWLRIHRGLGAITNAATSFALSPRDIGSIDLKYDDGRPGTGLIRMATAGTSTHCSGASAITVYTLSDPTPDCIPLVQIGN